MKRRPTDAHRTIAAWRTARWQARLEAAVRAALDVQRHRLAPARPGTSPADPFDSVTWADTVGMAVTPVAESILREAADTAARLVPKSLTAAARAAGGNLSTLQAALDDAVTAHAQSITDQVVGIADRLSPRITKAYSTATDAEDLSAQLDKIFSGADGTPVMISRLVNAFANSVGNQVAAEVHNSGATDPVTKTWVCSFNHSREWHMEADGQTVLVTEAFNVDGEDVDFPGDGSDENAANCQCSLAYDTLPTEQSDTGDEPTMEEAA